MNATRCALASILLVCATLRAQPPMLQVTGAVTDAETGEPIESFWVVPGVGSPDRQRFTYSEATEHENGDYVHLHLRGSGGDILRIEAYGYLPVVSPPLDTQDDATFDAQLRRGTNISGRVVTPDGEPAIGAEAMLISNVMSVHLENQWPGEHMTSPVVETDDGGRFSFRPIEDGPFDVVVLHDAGRARVTSKELASGDPVRLRPWARVEGVLMIGSKPGALQEISMRWAGTKSDWETREVWDYRTTTDENGRFTFDRVHAGDVTIGRIVRTSLRTKFPVAGVNNRQIIATAPGQTTRVTIGGMGRAVVGRVVLPPGLPDEFLLFQPTLAPPGERFRAAATTRPSQPNERTPFDEVLQHQYIVPVAADGSFRIDDVLPGDYRLNLDFRHYEFWRERPDGVGRSIGSVNLPVTVPEIAGGRTDEPLDLGAIKLQPR